MEQIEANEFEVREAIVNIKSRREILLNMLTANKITREEYANFYLAAQSPDIISEDIELIRSGESLAENNPTARLMSASNRIRSSTS